MLSIIIIVLVFKKYCTAQDREKCKFGPVAVTFIERIEVTWTIIEQTRSDRISIFIKEVWWTSGAQDFNTDLNLDVSQMLVIYWYNRITYNSLLTSLNTFTVMRRHIFEATSFY